MANAERIVDAVLSDLGGRKGIGDELDAIDPDIRAELRADLVAKVQGMLPRERGMEALQRTEALQPGDRCEFRYPARAEWQPGVVVRNGGPGYWHVRDEGDSEGRRGQVAEGLYIEHVRALGTDPWGHA